MAVEFFWVYIDVEYGNRMSSQTITHPTLQLRKMKNSKRQGDAGLAIAIAWFVANGYMVSIPLTDSQDYDLVIDDDITLKRVQVRTTYHKRASGFYAATLKVTGGNRSGAGKTKYLDPNKVHFLFVVTDMGEKYLFPTEKLDCKSSITLYEKYDVFRVE